MLITELLAVWIVGGLCARFMFLKALDIPDELPHVHIQNQRGEFMHCDLCYSRTLGIQARLDNLVGWLVVLMGLLGVLLMASIFFANLKSKKIALRFEAMVLTALRENTP